MIGGRKDHADRLSYVSYDESGNDDKSSERVLSGKVQ